MRSPQVDANNMACTTADNCLAGYICSGGICRKPGSSNGGDDAAGGNGGGDDASVTTPADSAVRADLAVPGPDLANADGPSRADVAPPDVPIAGSGGSGGVQTDVGGMPGTGGTGGPGGMATGQGGVAGSGGIAISTGGVAGSVGSGGTGGAATTAVVDCGLPPDPAHGLVRLTSTGPGSVATYARTTGYTLSGTSKRTCQADGRWSETAPTCGVVDCGRPANPANGIVSALTTTYQSKATYQCGSMYQLVGTETRTCQADGTWSDSAATCNCIAMCGSTCVDLYTDPNNCGACGNVCATTAPSEALSCYGVCIVKLIPAKSMTPRAFPGRRRHQRLLDGFGAWRGDEAPAARRPSHHAGQRSGQTPRHRRGCDERVL
jgi:hypothetical protein